VGGISSWRYLVHIHRADDRVGDIRIGGIMIDCRFRGVVGRMYAIPMQKRQVLHTIALHVLDNNVHFMQQFSLALKTNG